MPLSLNEFVPCIMSGSISKYLVNGRSGFGQPESLTQSYGIESSYLDENFEECIHHKKFRDYCCFAHSSMHFVESVVYNAMPGEYCGSVARVVRDYHNKVRYAFESVHADFLTGVSPEMCFQRFSKRIFHMKVKQLADLGQALMTCTCDPDIQVVNGISDAKQMSYMNGYCLTSFDRLYVNLPFEFADISHLPRNTSGEPGDYDEIDGHAEVVKKVKLPKWLKRVVEHVKPFLKDYVVPTLKFIPPIVALTASCVTATDMLDSLPPKPEKKSVQTELVVETQGGTPESITDCSAPSESSVDKVILKDSVPYLAAEARVYEDKQFFSHVEHFDVMDDYVMLPPENLPTGPSGATPVKVFRMKSTAYPRMSLISRMFSYMRTEWKTKLHAKVPFGMNGLLKIVALDAGLVGDGPTATVPTYNEVISRQGILWNLATEPECEFVVPWLRPDFVCTHGDTSGAFAMAFVTDPILPTGGSQPIPFAIDVKPHNPKFYVKRAIPPVSFVSVPMLGATGNTFLVPDEGGYFAVQGMSSNTTSLSYFVAGSPSANPIITSGVIFQNAVPAAAYGKLITFSATGTPPSIVFVRNSITAVTLQGGEYHENGGPEAQGSTPGANSKSGGVMGRTVGTAKVIVNAENDIYVPIRTYAYPSLSAAQNFKICPRNFGLNGNSGTYAPSQASQEAERFVFYGPKSGNNFIKVKITSVTNAYTNARVVFAWVPAGETLPTTVSGMSQFRNVEHTLHGGETIFPLDWIHPLPALYTNSTADFAGSLVFMSVETVTLTGQGTPQMTLWLSAGGMEYSTPRAPITFTPLT